MPKHYLEKGSGWQERLLDGLIFIVALPIGLALLLFCGEKPKGLKGKRRKNGSN